MRRRSVSVAARENNLYGIRTKVCEWCGSVFTMQANVKYAYKWKRNNNSGFYFCSWNCMCAAKRANGHEDLTGAAPTRIKGGWARKIV